MSDLVIERPSPAAWITPEGRGGKGGGSKEFREDPNSLKSRGIARILDLIGEGEIRGLVNGSKSIFLDDTPLESADGQLNFQGVSWAAVYGLPDQPHIPGFASVEAPLDGFAGVQLKKSVGPITRRVNDLTADAARITLSVPALNFTDEKNARLKGSSVQVRISVASMANSPGAVFKQVVLATIVGKTTSAYEEDYRVELPGEGPWDIRVERVTPDSENVKLVNETSWARTSLIYDHKFSYPYSALVGMEINAEYFGTSIPARAFEVYGLIIKVPSNYNPDTRRYTGLWDGTFKMAWTNNPAWVFYDLLTNTRYGLGLRAQHVDKWSLYTIAQYCDEMVGDGYGGTEPRFTFNGVITKQEEAHKVLQALASSFRGMIYWSTGMVTATQDRPEDPVKIFTPANVIGGDFEYSGTSKNARHTVAIVAWNNPELGYEIDYEVVEDPKAIRRLGMRPMDMTAYGCTSRGQARREGRWVLATESLETDGVRFKTGYEGADLVPGNIIAVADPAYAGVRMGGRLLDVNDNHVRMDAAFNFKPGETYEISIMSEGGQIVTRGVGNATGLNDIVQLVAPLPAEVEEGDEVGERPAIGAIFTLSEVGNVEPRPFRVISITEADKHQFEVFALEHRPEKYDIADNDAPFDVDSKNKFQDLPRANFCQPPRAPLTATLVQRERQFGLKPVLLVDWEPSLDPLVKGYIVTYRFGEENWVTLPMETNSSVEIDDPDMATYEIRVMAVNTFGHPSAMIRLSKDLNEFGNAEGAEALHGLQTPNGTLNFGGRDAVIEWNARPVSALESTADFRDAFFNGFEVCIFKRPQDAPADWQPPRREEDGTINLPPVRTEVVWDQTYTYTLEKNVEDGLSREFWAQVRMLSTGGGETPGEGSKSAPMIGRFYNAPPVLQPAQIVAQPYGVQLVVNPPADIDYAGVVVWMGDMQGFEPTDENMRWRNSGNPMLGMEPLQISYIRYALYDEFGMSDVTVSDEIMVQAPQIMVTEIDGRPVGDLSDAIDAINGFGDQVDTILADFDEFRQSVLENANGIDNLSQTAIQNALSITREAMERDRLTHIAGQEIGSFVTAQQARTDDMVETLDLIGVKSADGSGFVLKGTSIKMEDGQTLSGKFETIQSEIGENIGARIDAAEQAIATETSARTEAISGAVSVLNNNIAQSEGRSQTYADGVKTYTNNTFTTKTAFSTFQTTTNQSLNTLSDGLQSVVEFQNLLGAKSTDGTSIILDTSKVKVTAAESLSQRLTLIENRFGATSSSALLTRVNSAATDADAALDTLTQMGATIGNGAAYQIDASKVKVTSGGELLSSRLTSIGTSLNTKLTQTQVDARVTTGINTAIGSGGAIAQWATGAFTTKGELTATAGVLTESIDGVKARAGIYVDANGKVGGITVGANQTRVDMELVFNRIFFVDANGANRIQVLSYVSGQGWQFNSNITVVGKIAVKSAASGMRTEIDNFGVTVIHTNGVKVVELGVFED